MASLPHRPLALLAAAAAASASRRPVPDTDRVIVALRQRNLDRLERELMEVSDPACVSYLRFVKRPSPLSSIRTSA